MTQPLTAADLFILAAALTTRIAHDSLEDMRAEAENLISQVAKLHGQDHAERTAILVSQSHLQLGHVDVAVYTIREVLSRRLVRMAQLPPSAEKKGA
jgi:hypothetical protein